MRKLTILFTFILISSISWGAELPESCNFFLQSVTDHPEIRSAYTGLLDLNTSVLKGENKPGWVDINAVEKIIADLKTAKAKFADQGKLAEYEEISKKAKEALENLEDLKRIRSSAKDVELKDYQPSDFELKSLYRRLVMDLNQELPDGLEFATFKMRSNIESIRLAKESLEVIPRLNTKFDNLFSKSSGFKDYEEYLVALKQAAKSNKLIKDYMRLMRPENHRFVMARPESARWWIPKVGFHNQHVSQSSRGYLGNDGRNACEATYLTMKFDKYKELSSDLKPKYGYLEPTPEAKMDPTSVHYGDDIFVFKKPDVEPRITFTIGDSLNRLSNVHPDWSSGKSSVHPEDWDFLFIPWKYKESMVPSLALKHVGSEMKLSVSLGYYFGEETQFSILTSELTRMKIPHNPMANYVELQYYGHLGLENVERFEFKRLPPDGEFLKELQKHNIEIFDRRNNAWPPKKWNVGDP